MTVEKLVKKEPYITLETNVSETGSDTLSDSEWSVIETLFVKHPNLVKIWAPYRDPELMEKMAELKAKKRIECMHEDDTQAI